MILLATPAVQDAGVGLADGAAEFVITARAPHLAPAVDGVPIDGIVLRDSRADAEQHCEPGNTQEALERALARLHLIPYKSWVSPTCPGEVLDNDMKRVDGFWRLYKIDEGHTLARYGTWVEVASFIPEFIMERLTRSNLPVNMEAVHKYIQSGGTYTKPGFEEKK